jgi:hypothetical protein
MLTLGLELGLELNQQTPATGYIGKCTHPHADLRVRVRGRVKPADTSDRVYWQVHTHADLMVMVRVRVKPADTSDRVYWQVHTHADDIRTHAYSTTPLDSAQTADFSTQQT